ncbi:MAG: type II toxin-antitoxin system VapC family toxin [Pseudomonadota bacterium]
MIRLVADTSVAVKWLLPERDGEQHGEKALDLLRQIELGRASLHQPPHWLAEIAAVLARLSPATALEDIADLCDAEFAIMDAPEVYLTACRLSIELDHHLFDTLYHAVALAIPDAMLITADERYYQKAKKFGRIELLADLCF